MCRPRFRLRTLLIAVTVVGMVLGGGITLWRRYESRWQMALFHWERAQQHYRIAIRYPRKHPIVKRLVRQAEPYQMVAERYRWAALHPWEPLPPELKPLP